MYHNLWYKANTFYFVFITSLKYVGNRDADQKILYLYAILSVMAMIFSFHFEIPFLYYHLSTKTSYVDRLVLQILSTMHYTMSNI